MSHCQDLIIGGGVIGVSTAYFLALRGRRVTLVEQGDLCSGSSQGNAGQVTPGHLPLPQPGTLGRNLRWLFRSTSPLYVAPRLDLQLLRWLWRFQRACNPDHLRRATRVLCDLGEASAQLFAELSREIDVRYEYPGRLEVCRGEPSFRAACAEAALLEEFGFAARRLRGPEVRDFEPAVAGAVAGAVYYPDSGYCNPHTFVLRLADAAQKKGATFRTGQCVTGIRVERGRVVSVHCGGEQLKAETVVLACGSWAPQLTTPLGTALPVQPGKGYHVDVDRPAKCPRVPLVLLEERIFVSPLDDFVRLAGTMELSGFNLRPRAERWEMLTVGASRYFPELAQGTIRSRWCHLRPMSADGLPVIGPLPRVENAWIATGHGMLGFTQGPITGRLLAEWVTEGKPSLDLTDVRADRF